MRPGLFPTLRNYKQRFLSKDISTGLIIAATSIPVSMGYAQIAGLPAIFGLYGSVFPVLLFAALSTSPQFIFGVDAAPAALIGGTLASMGIALGSEEAIRVIPAITMFVALWLLLFSLLMGGKIVNYISSPVMGGFITGIGVTIILMQLPKLMGSEAGTGELVELTESLFAACLSINGLSLAMGLGSLAILLIFQRLFPRFPMPVVLMALGVFSTIVFHIDEHGVALLSAVEKGMPKLVIPDFSIEEVTYLLGASLPIAIVILAETLLIENNYAIKYGYKLDDDREILAFSAGNFAAAFTGCLPVIGSVPRTAISEQYGMKTQLGSLVASAALMAVLLFCTGFIGYLPVPVITAIVIASIVSVLEFDLAARLSNSDKTEFLIFIAAFLGVLVLGTIYGVIIGILLSFLTVMIRAAYPPRDFLGILPGREGFYPLDRYRNVQPIEGVVIYRFSGNLFFASINAFQNDIESSVGSETKVVIVDAGGVAAIDITAADRLDILINRLHKQGVRFYITEHIGTLNDRLRELGKSHIVEEGIARRTIEAALADAGITNPYSAVCQGQENTSASFDLTSHEFDWAFGKDADAQMEKHALEIIEHLNAEQGKLDLNAADRWDALGTVDENDLLDHLEMHTGEIAAKLNMSEEAVEEYISAGRLRLVKHLMCSNPDMLQTLLDHRHELEQRLLKQNPQLAEKVLTLRAKRLDCLRQADPAAAQILEDLLK